MARAGLSIRIIKKDMTTEIVNRNILYFMKELPEVVYNIGIKTAEVMRKTISTQKKRAGSKGNLENKIRVYKIGRKHFRGVGVGRIGLLNKSAPYWRLLNYGGMVSPLARKVPGWFLPNQTAPDSRFGGIKGGAREEFEYVPRGKEGKNKKFIMNVNTPITGMHYIEKGRRYLKYGLFIGLRASFRKLNRKI